jgi:hypothetical protein
MPSYSGSHSRSALGTTIRWITEALLGHTRGGPTWSGVGVRRSAVALFLPFSILQLLEAPEHLRLEHGHVKVRPQRFFGRPHLELRRPQVALKKLDDLGKPLANHEGKAGGNSEFEEPLYQGSSVARFIGFIQNSSLPAQIDSA